jgi:hypothetical protein
MFSHSAVRTLGDCHLGNLLAGGGGGGDTWTLGERTRY